MLSRTIPTTILGLTVPSHISLHILYWLLHAGEIIKYILELCFCMLTIISCMLVTFLIVNQCIKSQRLEYFYKVSHFFY